MREQCVLGIFGEEQEAKKQVNLMCCVLRVLCVSMPYSVIKQRRDWEKEQKEAAAAAINTAELPKSVSKDPTKSVEEEPPKPEPAGTPVVSKPIKRKASWKNRFKDRKAAKTEQVCSFVYHKYKHRSDTFDAHSSTALFSTRPPQPSQLALG